MWGNRLNNLRTDGSEGAALVTSLVLSLVSLAAAVATVAVVIVAWRRGTALGVGAGRLVRAFAGWTVAVWIVRAVDIVMDWRSIGFVVVHVALAAVSIALAAWAWRAAPVGDRADAPAEAIGS